MARSLLEENRIWSINNYLPNWQLLVAVDHNQVRKMAAETVDPIVWLHLPPSWAAPPERLVHSINRCSLCRESTLQHSACKALPMRPLRVYSIFIMPASIGSTKKFFQNITYQKILVLKDDSGKLYRIISIIHYWFVYFILE